MENVIGKRFSVLDKGWVELVDVMPHPDSDISGDLAIVNAARVSFLGESKGDKQDKKLLFYLMEHHHTSPFEMVEFKFRVHAPLVVWWQWARHRTWSFNMQSGRYTPFEEDEFYVPHVWRKQSHDNKQASDGILPLKDSATLTQQLDDYINVGYKLYQQAIDLGVAREMARLFIPAFGVYYTGVVKVDAHNLMNFFQLRRASDAQYEIRVYADIMYYEFFKPTLQWTAEAFEEYRM